MTLKVPIRTQLSFRSRLGERLDPMTRPTLIFVNLAGTEAFLDAATALRRADLDLNGIPPVWVCTRYPDKHAER
jgi:hypothetical protein